MGMLVTLHPLRGFIHMNSQKKEKELCPRQHISNNLIGALDRSYFNAKYK